MTAICTACGRPADNHPFRHPFTTVEGGSLPESTRVEQHNPMPTPVADSTSLGRLVKILHRRGVISDDDLLEIVGL